MPSIHVSLRNAVKLTSNSPPGAPIAGHGGSAEWWKHHKSTSGGTTSTSNSTKIKEREAHEYVYLSNHPKVVKLMSNRKPGTFPGDPKKHPHDGWPSSSSGGNSTKIKEREAHEYVYLSNHPKVVKLMSNRKPGTFPGDPKKRPHDGWPSSSGGGNSSKIKERQGGPPRGDFTPPNGMTYASFPWY